MMTENGIESTLGGGVRRFHRDFRQIATRQVGGERQPQKRLGGADPAQPNRSIVQEGLDGA
jgi:hypothetical protein